MGGLGWNFTCAGLDCCMTGRTETPRCGIGVAPSVKPLLSVAHASTSTVLMAVITSEVDLASQVQASHEINFVTILRVNLAPWPRVPDAYRLRAS